MIRKIQPGETVDSCNVEMSIKISLKAPEASKWCNVMVKEVKTILKMILLML